MARTSNLLRAVALAGLFVSALAHANSAIEPVPRDKEDWWVKRVAEKDEQLKKGGVDLLFIGDSITQGWEAFGKDTWEKYYANRHAVNLGFSGDRTEHVLWRLAHSPMDGLKPKAAVIMIGTNNVGHNTGNSAEDVAAGDKAIVDWLRAKYPEMQILLLGIFPRDEKPDEPKRKAVDAINPLIAKLDDGKLVHFLDIGHEFLDGAILPKSIMSDFLHPNGKGYEIWAAAMEPALARLLNETPVGYVPLYNGKDLTGWKGLVLDPEKRASMTPEELAAKQKEADEKMASAWHPQPDGIIYFDGSGSHLCTTRWYEDFEMTVDYKIESHGDSGIYLRGSPQVQIWDRDQWPKGVKGTPGSGGLYNNKIGNPDPLVFADNPIGEWNSFHIKMIGDKVTVYLNNKLVVDKEVLENYWNRNKPIYPAEQIELQAHGTKVWWKNINVREIPRGDGWRDLFNGKDTGGWEKIGNKDTTWNAENGVLYTEGSGGAWLCTKEEYGDFELEAEFKLPPNGNSGIFIRAPRDGNPAFEGMEVQILDDGGDEYKTLEPWQYCGSVYKVAAPARRWTNAPGEWQKMQIRCEGQRVQVAVNGHPIIDTKQDEHPDKLKEHPGLKRLKGYIGLQNHQTRVDFRNIRIRPLN